MTDGDNDFDHDKDIDPDETVDVGKGSTDKVLTIDESLTVRNKNIHSPMIAYLNVNSLRNKISDVRFLLQNLNISILFLSETKIDDTFPNQQFIAESYQTPGDYRKDRNKHGGGLIGYVRNGIPNWKLKEFEPENLEIVCSEVNFNCNKWAIISVYHSHLYTNIKVFF